MPILICVCDSLKLRLSSSKSFNVMSCKFLSHLSRVHCTWETEGWLDRPGEPSPPLRLPVTPIYIWIAETHLQTIFLITVHPHILIRRLAAVREIDVRAAVPASTLHSNVVIRTSLVATLEGRPSLLLWALSSFLEHPLAVRGAATPPPPLNRPCVDNSTRNTKWQFGHGGWRLKMAWN